jgi:predicted ATPase
VLRRWQVRDGRLFSDHELQLRNEVHNELTVRTQRLAKGIPPLAKLRLAPQDAQNRFRAAFGRFLGVFARAEHPLASAVSR